MKKFYSLAVLMLLFVAQSQAQVTSALKDFDNTWIKPLIPIVGALCFIVGALMNIGKLQGENRDYKGFFTGVALYIGGFLVIVAAYKFFLSYSV